MNFIVNLKDLKIIMNGIKKVYGYNDLVKRFAVDIAYLFLKNEELYDFNKNLEIPKRK